MKRVDFLMSSCSAIERGFGTKMELGAVETLNKKQNCSPRCAITVWVRNNTGSQLCAQLREDDAWYNLMEVCRVVYARHTSLVDF